MYRDTEPGAEYLRFKKGLVLNNEPEMAFEFPESPLDKLRRLGCLWTTLLTPLINREIALALVSVAPDNVQLLKAVALTADGKCDEFSFLNIVGVCPCMDLEKSKLYFFDDGEISGVQKLRFKADGCMGRSQLARLEHSKSYIIVSELVVAALSRLKFKGLHFELDRDGDGFR